MVRRICCFVFVAIAIAAGAWAENGVAPASFHHVELNVTDAEKSIEFYSRIFGAVPIRYRGVSEALFTERSFVLLNEVETAPPAALESGIWHIGWGGVDMPNEYEWFKAQGVSIHTPLYQLGSGYVTYLEGPDKELIEVNTMGHHRFGHVHLFAADVNETVQWYVQHLGVRARRDHVPKPDLTKARAWSNGFRVDNISFIVYGRPDYEPRPPWWRWEPLTEFEPQRGRAIDHYAFSYRDIDPVYDRMAEDGVEIVQSIAYRKEFDHLSFFVMGPDKVTIEIVEAKPIPEASWE